MASEASAAIVNVPPPPPPPGRDLSSPKARAAELPPAPPAPKKLKEEPLPTGLDSAPKTPDNFPGASVVASFEGCEDDDEGMLPCGNHPGTKGYGKKSSMGVPIPPPTTIPTPKTTAAPAAPSVASGSKARGTTPGVPVPTPIQIDEAMADAYIKEWYSVMEYKRHDPPRVGDQVLWKGLKKGKRGGESTGVEYFNGKIHEIKPSEHGPLYSVS